MSSLAELARLTHLDPKRAISVPAGGGGLSMHELDVDPYDFLMLAEEDWERGGLAAILFRYEAPVLGGAFDEGFPHDGVR